MLFCLFALFGAAPRLRKQLACRAGLVGDNEAFIVAGSGGLEETKAEVECSDLEAAMEKASFSFYVGPTVPAIFCVCIGYCCTFNEAEGEFFFINTPLMGCKPNDSDH